MNIRFDFLALRGYQYSSETFRNWRKFGPDLVVQAKATTTMDTDIDDQTIARFVEATSASPEHATFFLQACDGNFDRAVQMFQGGIIALMLSSK